MAALQTKGFVFGDIPHHRNVISGLFQFLLKHVFQSGIKHLRHAVQQDSPDITVGAELNDTANKCCKRERRSPAGNHKYNRDLKCPCHIVGASRIRIHPAAVIISHNSLCHSDIRTR